MMIAPRGRGVLLRREDGMHRRAEAWGRGRGTTVWRTLRTVPILAAFWLILSGHFQPLLLTFGAASVVVVCWMTVRSGLDQHHGMTVRFALRLPWFLLWLGAKVLVSALAVVRKIWSPRPDLRPVAAPTPARDLPELSQVIYANAITLTPGTLSLDVGDERVEVHGLDPAGVDELHEGAMLSQVRRTGAR